MTPMTAAGGLSGNVPSIVAPRPAVPRRPARYGQAQEPAAIFTDQSGLASCWAEGRPVLPDLTPARRRTLARKRILDVVLAGFGLLLLAPFLAAIALAIKLSSRGPAIFGQVRIGEAGRPFRMYKFRTMRQDDCDPHGQDTPSLGDRRITAIGRVLRRTSLDELPQLLNVLRGDMSLVGPRPHVRSQKAGGLRYGRLVPYYAIRQSVRPGMTGWAQANGYRGSTADPLRARLRIDHDVAYIQNLSVLLDLRILILTIWREFLTGSGR